MTWSFFLSMIALIVTGGCLYFGVCANHFVRSVHYYATWSVISFVGLHVLNHAAIGGKSQLMRVFRPERLPAPPKRLDAVELLTMLVEQEERMLAEVRARGEVPMHSPLQPAQMPNDIGWADGREFAVCPGNWDTREMPNDDRMNPRRAADRTQPATESDPAGQSAGRRRGRSHHRRFAGV